jgi:uncharacterized membrane protein
MRTKKLGTILAATVGTLFAANAFAGAMSSTPGPTTATGVKCIGINACKGQSACKTATSSCKGQNSCKGTGMIMTATDKECTEKGGRVDTSTTDMK